VEQQYRQKAAGCAQGGDGCALRKQEEYAGSEEPLPTIFKEMGPLYYWVP